MSIIPKTRPTQSRAALEKIIQGCGDAKAVKWPVVVISWRAYFRDSMGKPGRNDRGIYDDGFFIVTPDQVLSFNGNNDPSKYEEGIAKLTLGVHWYTRGIHGVSKPKSQQYWAWIPATLGKRLPVIRDGDTEPSIGVACNIHRGGEKGTSSAGCQTVPPSQWSEFDNALESAIKKHKVTKFPCILIEKPDL